MQRGNTAAKFAHVTEFRLCSIDNQPHLKWDNSGGAQNASARRAAKLIARYRARCGRERQSEHTEPAEQFDRTDEAVAVFVAKGSRRSDWAISAWHTNAKECSDAGTFATE